MYYKKKPNTSIQTKTIDVIKEAYMSYLPGKHMNKVMFNLLKGYDKTKHKYAMQKFMMSIIDKCIMSEEVVFLN